MRPRPVAAVSAVLLAFLAAAVPASAELPYQFTDQSGGGAYLVTGINNKGDIVGNASYFGTKAFARRNGVTTYLDYLPTQHPSGTYYGSRYSTARDINDAGVVVGEASNGLDGRYFGGHHGVVWRPYDPANQTPTAAFDLGALAYGSNDCNNVMPQGDLSCYTRATGINVHDDVTGYGELRVETPSGSGWFAYPWLVPKGDRKLFAGSGQNFSIDLLFVNQKRISYEATAINDAKQVVVYPDPLAPAGEDRSAIYPGGTSIPFESSIHEGARQAINNAGWVVGTSTVSGVRTAKLWKGSSVVDLPPVSGDTQSSASAINEKGDVVGSSWGASGCRRAVKWPHDDYAHPVDLNAKTDTTWQLYEAHGINDKGQIIGAGYTTKTCTGGTFKPFSITPPPALAIADGQVAEPESGTADMTFEVTLGLTLSESITVDYATADGTGDFAAKAGEDYEARSGTLTFAAGETKKTITVPVKANGFQADRTFFVNLSNASDSIGIEDAQASGRIRGRGPLEVTLTADPAKVDVAQTAAGPEPKQVIVDVAVKNRSKTPITSVTVPDKLTTGWDGPSPIVALPIAQTPPAEADRTFGPLAPGETRHFTYTLAVSGDGKYVLDVLVEGDAGGQGFTAFATTKLDALSQLLVWKAEMGAHVRSQKAPQLIKAGTTFLIAIELENRSKYKTIVVEPIYPALGGNAADGHVQDDGTYTGAPPTGSPNEVQPSKFLVLTPGQKRKVVSIVRTTASDAFVESGEKATGIGGTRALVHFEVPKIHEVVDDETGRHLSPLAADRVHMAKDSTDFVVGLDDSAPDPPPFGYAEATWYAGKGVVQGLWQLTYGTARGLVYDLPKALAGGVISVSSASLNAIDHTVELWYATADDPAARAQIVNQIADKIITVYDEAPYALAMAPNAIFNSASAAVGAKMDQMSKQWFAGDWRGAMTEFTKGGTETIGNVALSLGPGILARSPRAAQLWQASKAKTYAQVTKTLAPVTARVTRVKQAVKALKKVKPGFQFNATHMAKIYGVSSKEMQRLMAFAAKHKLSIVLRSRAQESIAFLEKGLAVVKPYWIKSKNVSHVDHEFLGYDFDDIGKVVIRKPLARAKVEANLAKKGFKQGTPQYKEAIDRWKVRSKEYKTEYREMQKWHKAGKVKGKWPWGDNGVDPRVRADEYSTVRFRLLPDKKGNVVPQVHVGGKWKFITGDIDLIAITKANGDALSDVQHVAVLDELKTVLGAQHPESATWVNKGKFWFKAKRGYLTNDGECCLAQFGPDGKVRAVEFDEKLSEPDKWTKLKYRIRWKGGYQVGFGQ